MVIFCSANRNFNFFLLSTSLGDDQCEELSKFVVIIAYTHIPLICVHDCMFVYTEWGNSRLFCVWKEEKRWSDMHTTCLLTCAGTHGIIMVHTWLTLAQPGKSVKLRYYDRNVKYNLEFKSYDGFFLLFILFIQFFLFRCFFHLKYIVFVCIFSYSWIILWIA